MGAQASGSEHASEERKMTIADIKKNLDGKMDLSIQAFKNNLTRIRTGRANPALLDTVQVDYYGSLMPISQVANVSLLDSRTISVQPWEKGMGAKIEKAIRESDLGLNPASMGDLIRVPMPPMSEERRKEMTTCAAMPTRPSKSWSRTSWRPRTTRSAPRRRSRRSRTSTLPKSTSW
jgi:ribosome recycling factor